MLPRRLAEVTNDGGVEGLVSFALPEGVGGLHEQVFERERRVGGSHAMRAGEARRSGIEAGGEQQSFAQRFVGSTGVRQLRRDSRLADVVGRGAETHERPVDAKVCVRERVNEPSGDVVDEDEVRDEPRWSALGFEQLEHPRWK